jgi:putative ubiquitin-RnfH superfamily antitoxin RatB of RatAB toxin-antitoxin module
MEPDASGMRVEVVYAERHRQALCSVVLPPGSTVQDAIEQSGIAREVAAITISSCKVGVFGRVCARNTPVRDGDRVEIYRPLVIEPKDARRGRGKRNRPARGPG